jgi:hypothetical protein
MNYFWVVFLLIVSQFKFAFSQQKDKLIVYNDGTACFHLISKTDTTFTVIYPNKKKEAECVLRNGELHGLYKRWYENGNKMWIQAMENGILNGQSSFFNHKGELILTLFYKNGELIDTLFSKPNIHLLMGKLKYKSIVYGGVEREDGRSNVSETEGVYKNIEMNLVKLDSIKKPELIVKIKSDQFGNFIALVPTGNLGIYPTHIKLEDLKPPYSNIPAQRSMSGSDNWNVNFPIKIYKNEIIKTITIAHSSVGYAP